MTNDKHQISKLVRMDKFQCPKFQLLKQFHSCFEHPYGQVLIINIWNLFVICFLLFGA